MSPKRSLWILSGLLLFASGMVLTVFSHEIAKYFVGGFKMSLGLLFSVDRLHYLIRFIQGTGIALGAVGLGAGYRGLRKKIGPDSKIRPLNRARIFI